ncbi:MAG TPA: cyclase family protein [Caldilineaceae bacterium]|nr:cyclase family protein [Caldilineaceae bacterium]
MRIIDISGPIEDGMWSYGEPYPAPQITQIPPPAWLDYPVYSQTVAMAVQSGTYLETAAHMDQSRLPVDQLPLSRCHRIDAVALWIPRGANEPISAADLERALTNAGFMLQPGDALLVGTGWDSQWYAPNYVTDPPYFLADAIDWVLDHKIALLGGDTPRYDSPHHPQNFFPKFFQSEILLLAPLVNMAQVGTARGKLTALPLKIKDACASPVRALWIED